MLVVIEMLHNVAGLLDESSDSSPNELVSNVSQLLDSMTELWIGPPYWKLYETKQYKVD